MYGWGKLRSNVTRLPAPRTLRLPADGQKQSHRVGLEADQQGSIRESRQGVPAGPGDRSGRRPRPAEARRAVPEDEPQGGGGRLLREGGKDVRGAGLLLEGGGSLQAGAQGHRPRRGERAPRRAVSAARAGG